MNTKCLHGITFGSHCKDCNREAARALSRKRESAGWVPEPACAVEDNDGNHCPSNPEIWANLKSTGEEVWLCKQCYRNALERGQIEESNREITCGGEE